MKKQLLIAAVAATMGTAAMADVSITGDAKFEYFNTETSTVSTNKTNTEVNLGIKGKNGDTTVVANLEFNTHDAASNTVSAMDIEDLYMTTKIGDVTVKGGNYATGTSAILGEIENGGRASNKVTISGSTGGVSWYAGNSAAAGEGSTQLNGNMFVGGSMDVAGWKVQAKHNSATVDSFGISGEVSGVGIRLEQKNDTAANGDTTFGNVTYSTNGIDLAYAWLDSDKANQIDEDDSVTSEELYLRIPACTKPGTYDATVTVSYHDGDYSETRNEKITVIQGDLCELNKDPVAPIQPKTIITVGPTSQDVIQGQGGVIYPLTLSNAGSEARTYVIAADGYADWADVSVSPANIVVLQSGEAKALYVYVSANEDAPVGEHMFSLTVTSGAETLKEFVLKSNVVAGEAEPVTTNWGGVKKVLEIGLVVLVVLLVILGLIIGFSRLKGSDDDFDDDDDEGKSETYY